MSVEDLEREAMKLSTEERERLALALLSSVHGDLEYEAEWADEADRRVLEIRERKVDPIPGDQVFREALRRLE
jgi:putative addiction module component (TIGR02574 family)